MSWKCDTCGEEFNYLDEMTFLDWEDNILDSNMDYEVPYDRKICNVCYDEEFDF